MTSALSTHGMYAFGIPGRSLQREGVDGLRHVIEQKNWARVMLIMNTESGKREATMADGVGRHPVHYACRLGAPVEVIRALLTANPSAVQIPDNHGRLPIHFCCEGTPLPSARAVLAANPQGLQIKDMEGCLPLHHACYYGASLEIIEEFLEVYPDGASAKDADEKIPLHHVLEDLGEPEDIVSVVRKLLEVYPDGARSKDSSENLPIHLALDDAPLQVVQDLLHAFPNSAKIHNREGLLPLSIACGDKAAPEVIRAVFDAFPEAAGIWDSYGHTPLLDSFQYELPKAVALFMIEQYPFCARVYQRENGRFPLHLACEYGADVDVIQKLLSVFPPGARMKDVSQQLPIHYEYSRHRRSIVIQSLLDVYPEAASFQINGDESWSSIMLNHL